MNLNKINKIHLSMAFGFGITGLFFVIAAGGASRADFPFGGFAVP